MRAAGVRHGGKRLLTALARGRRFGVISILESSLARHLSYIRELGIETRLAADLPLGLGVLELQDHTVALDRMTTVGARLRDEHDADVIVMGCAGMAALRNPLEESSAFPLSSRSRRQSAWPWERWLSVEH